MTLVTSIRAWLHRDDEGQGLAEYALILALIAILAVVALLFMGGSINTVLSKLGNSL
jgi:pilus assembly protein Flp/PilA